MWSERVYESNEQIIECIITVKKMAIEDVKQSSK